jgi:hypothetical protein
MAPVVTVAYTMECWHTFSIPDGIDLDDKRSVKHWHADNEMLYITLVDNTTIKVEGGEGEKEFVFKCYEIGDDEA